MAKAPSSSRHADKDPEAVAYGAQLRAMRLERSMTQEALAEAAEVHWSYIGQIERGERNLSMKNVLRMSRGLGVSPGAVLEAAFGNPVSQRSNG